MSEIQEIVVAPEQQGQRLDHVLKGLGFARPRRLALFSAGSIKVNGRRAAKGYSLRSGDRITVADAQDARSHGVGPAPDHELELRIIYEDAWLVAVDKPAGVPSHALVAGELHTIGSALLARYPEMAVVGHRPLEPGLLHRLDTETSGLLMAARDRESFERMHAAHRRGELDKRYRALCHGRVQAPRLDHAYLLADRRRVRVRTLAFPGARSIQTELLRAEPRGDFSLVEVRVAFAARHQVRAHLAALGHPIANDPLYGGAPLATLARHFLHASRLSFEHPHTGRRIELEAPLPADLLHALDSLPR